MLGACWSSISRTRQFAAMKYRLFLAGVMISSVIAHYLNAQQLSSLNLAIRSSYLDLDQSKTLPTPLIIRDEPILQSSAETSGRQFLFPRTKGKQKSQRESERESHGKSHRKSEEKIQPFTVQIDRLRLDRPPEPHNELLTEPLGWAPRDAPLSSQQKDARLYAIM